MKEFEGWTKFIEQRPNGSVYSVLFKEDNDGNVWWRYKDSNHQETCHVFNQWIERCNYCGKALKDTSVTDKCEGRK